MWWARTVVTRSPVAQPPTNTSDSHRSPSACTAISSIARLGFSTREASIISGAPRVIYAQSHVPWPGRFARHQTAREAHRTADRRSQQAGVFHIEEEGHLLESSLPDAAIPGSSCPTPVLCLSEGPPHALWENRSSLHLARAGRRKGHRLR